MQIGIIDLNAPELGFHDGDVVALTLRATDRANQTSSTTTILLVTDDAPNPGAGDRVGALRDASQATKSVLRSVDETLAKAELARQRGELAALDVARLARAGDSAAKLHRALLRAGVEADLHVFDGLGHCFYYDDAMPESQDAYQTMIRFFRKHLGAR